jgi:hypothetical protein
MYNQNMAKNTPSTIHWAAADDSVQARGSGWYAAWVFIFLVLAGGSFALFWFFGQWQFFSILVLAIMIFIALVVANKQGKTIDYSVSGKEISIGSNIYPLANFRSFSVTKNGNLTLLSLIPTKRFALASDMILPAEQEADVLAILGDALPREDSALSAFDSISSRLKL